MENEDANMKNRTMISHTYILWHALEEEIREECDVKR